MLSILLIVGIIVTVIVLLFGGKKVEEFSPTPWCVTKTLFKVMRDALFGEKMYDIIVLEYGIDRPKEMEFLLQIAKPNI